jgi:glutathione S-transferase
VHVHVHVHAHAHVHVVVAGVRAQLETQSAREPGYFLVGSCFTAADVLLVHCCDWAAGIDADKGPAACWFSKYADDVVFQDYLGRMRARPAYLRAKQIQEDSPALA